LPDSSGVGLVEQFEQQFFGDVLRRCGAAIGEPDLDLKRVSPIDGRRACGSDVKFGWHDVMQAFENEIFTDGTDAVGRRIGDFCFLNRLIK